MNNLIIWFYLALLFSQLHFILSTLKCSCCEVTLCVTPCFVNADESLQNMGWHKASPHNDCTLFWNACCSVYCYTVGIVASPVYSYANRAQSNLAHQTACSLSLCGLIAFEQMDIHSSSRTTSRSVRSHKLSEDLQPKLEHVQRIIWMYRIVQNLCIDNRAVNQEVEKPHSPSSWSATHAVSRRSTPAIRAVYSNTICGQETVIADSSFCILFTVPREVGLNAVDITCTSFVSLRCMLLTSPLILAFTEACFLTCHHR